MSLVIYSKKDCSQCDQLIALLKTNYYEFTVLKLDTDFVLSELFDLFSIKSWERPRSFPVVLKDGELIGGFIKAKKAIADKTL